MGANFFLRKCLLKWRKSYGKVVLKEPKERRAGGSKMGGTRAGEGGEEEWGR
jgi:hypothetical protein